MAAKNAGERHDPSVEEPAASRASTSSNALYRERAFATRGAGLDAAARAVLEEELRSPCYDELAVFQAFSRIGIAARRELVILDTAPTGHTVLLLETAEIYHRKIVEGRRHEAIDDAVVRPRIRVVQSHSGGEGRQTRRPISSDSVK